jgi:invasion protein IalB
MQRKRAMDWLFASTLLAALAWPPVAAQTPPAPGTRAPAVTPPKQKAVRQAPAPPTAAAAPTVSPRDAGQRPSATTATYGDWVVRCIEPAGGHVCEAAQTIYRQGQQSPIAVIAIGLKKQGDPLRLVLQVPVNVSVTTRAQIAVHEGTSGIELPFERCVPAGCFAVIEAADEAIKRLRAQTNPVRFHYKDATQRNIEFQFSLRGLASALDALAKS